ncbi:hypothetical protein HZY86_02750 [Aerococcaceae bacterium DSM 111020]|nr:hypothetical protein [Aerococcaceae bacterium DSM 111020]
MEIEVTPEAAAWFDENVGIPVDQKDAGVRFKTMIYASSPVNPGFGLAIEPNSPKNPVAQYTTDQGLLFFIEESDEWFFEGHDLRVEFDAEKEEPKYIYLKDGVAIN